MFRLRFNQIDGPHMFSFSLFLSWLFLFLFWVGGVYFHENSFSMLALSSHYTIFLASNIVFCEFVSLLRNCNHLADPVSLVRDHQIKQKLGELNITVLSYNGDLLYEPWEVYDNNGDAFTTFAPFWDKCLNMNIEPASLPTPWRLVPASGAC